MEVLIVRRLFQLAHQEAPVIFRGSLLSFSQVCLDKAILVSFPRVPEIISIEMWRCSSFIFLVTSAAGLAVDLVGINWFSKDFVFSGM